MLPIQYTVSLAWESKDLLLYEIYTVSFSVLADSLVGPSVSSQPQTSHISPDNKVHGANMGPIWDRQDPGGTQLGPMNFAIWVSR